MATRHAVSGAQSAVFHSPSPAAKKECTKFAVVYSAAGCAESLLPVTRVTTPARYYLDFRARHSSAVISHNSLGSLPETYSRSSRAITRMPCLSEMLREAVLATALGDRRTGNFSTSNQYSVTASQASVMYPCPCHGGASQKPRLWFSAFIRLMLPIIRSGSDFSRIVQCHSSPRCIAGSTMLR